LPTETLRPNGAGDYQEFETLVDTSHWEATKDVDDATYIQTVGGVDKRDIQALQDPTFDAGDIINSVTIYCRAYTIGSGGKERIGFLDRLNTTDRVTGNLIVTRNAWNEYNSGALTTAPDGLGWTKQKVIDFQAGVKVTVLGGSETMRISEIWIVVNYTPAAGFRKLQYTSEPPTTGAFNQLKYVSEPPVPGAWNKLAYEGE